MTRNKGILFVSLLALLIAFLHFSALYFHLYWSLWWYDIVMHFLGGVWVGGCALWYLFLSGFKHKKINMHPMLVSLLVTLTVGISWEIYEYIFGMTMVSHESYLVDTALDLFMDAIGAIAVVPLFTSPRNKEILV